MLMMAVANSSFVTRYYDIAFHNKLYAGRRRFMTQYVKKFPLPDVEAPVAQRVVRLVRELVASKMPDPEPRGRNRPTRLGELRPSQRNARVAVFAALRSSRFPQTCGRT